MVCLSSHFILPLPSLLTAHTVAIMGRTGNNTSRFFKNARFLLSGSFFRYIFISDCSPAQLVCSICQCGGAMYVNKLIAKSFNCWGWRNRDPFPVWTLKKTKNKIKKSSHKQVWTRIPNFICHSLEIIG